MFIPIKDDAPTYRTPYVTITIIVLNTLIFFFTRGQGYDAFNAITIQFGYIPFEFTTGYELTPQLPASTYFTMFSSMFMHGGWMHLIGNMLFLWIFGNNIEDYFGRIKFVLFYLASGIAAIALFTAFGPNSQVPLVGASGAIAGLMGGYMLLHPKAQITVLIIFIFIQFIHVPAKIVIGIWFALQLFMSLTQNSSGGGVAYLAHVGGFIFGWLILKLVIKITGKGGGGGTTPNGQRVYRMQW
ncbi:MAG: rhomboid family intramembrane serine protease [Calditrichaeota bacterium]|nr:MAG: rhomboid family intramembrane serine protease [Calditrichota bacterium]